MTIESKSKSLYESGHIHFLYANICLFLLQQYKSMANTVQNILQNNLKGQKVMIKKYAEQITWQSQPQQATSDGHIDLNVTFLSNTNTMYCPASHF